MDAVATRAIAGLACINVPDSQGHFHACQVHVKNDQRDEDELSLSVYHYPSLMFDVFHVSRTTQTPGAMIPQFSPSPGLKRSLETPEITIMIARRAL